MNKKNLIVVTRSTIYHSQTGGIETQLNNLLIGLKDIYKITVLTTSLPLYTDRFTEKEGSFEFYDNENLKYVFIKNTNIGSLDIQFWPKFIYNIVLLPRFRKALLKIFRLQNSEGNFFSGVQRYIDSNKANIDIILSQSTSITNVNTYTLPIVTVIHGTIGGEIKGRYNWLASIKSYVRFIGYDLPYLLSIKYLVDKNLFQKSSKIIAVSDNLKNDFLNEYPNLADKLEVIYNGVDEQKLSNIKNIKLPLKIIYVGKIDIEKGLEVINEVLTKIDYKKYNIEFTLIGDGAYYEKIQNTINDNGLTADVKLLGKQPQSVVYEKFKESHIFLFPTLRIEGHPMVLIESMLAGTVPMVNPLGGIKDVVTEQNSIIIPADSDVIIKKLYNIYNDLDHLKRLHEQTLLDGHKFSQSKMVDNYDKIFKSLIKEL